MSKKSEVLKIFDAALDAVLPHNAINNSVKLNENKLSVLDSEYNLNNYKNIYLCGSGKASLLMAEEIENILGSLIHSGVVISPMNDSKLKYATHLNSTHPIPTQKSLDASYEMLNSLEEMKEDDLLIYCLSGGSSALLELPLEDITLEEFAQTTKILLENGFAIDKINSVRKHLSQVKGGRLAMATKAEVIVLVISDVVGDDLESIASAPFYFDSSTFEDVENILYEKNVFMQLPHNVQSVIKDGLSGKIKETAKELKEKVYHAIISNNHLALKASADYAKELGFSVRLVKKSIEGSVENAAHEFLKKAKELQEDEVLIQGGETTVNVIGTGVGGRNQHFALCALAELDEKIIILSAGTDGIDGNSQDAGAVISLEIKEAANNLNISINKYINDYDSNNFFKQLNTLISPGYTGTNVMDIMIAIKE